MAGGSRSNTCELLASGSYSNHHLDSAANLHTMAASDSEEDDAERFIKRRTKVCDVDARRCAMLRSASSSDARRCAGPCMRASTCVHVCACMTVGGTPPSAGSVQRIG